MDRHAEVNDPGKGEGFCQARVGLPHRQVADVEKETPGKPHSWGWADLMRRAFGLDVLACPRCGGRMRLIATIEDPLVIRRILSHLGLATEVPHARPPRPPPGLSGALFADIPA